MIALPKQCEPADLRHRIREAIVNWPREGLPALCELPPPPFGLWWTSRETGHSNLNFSTGLPHPEPSRAGRDAMEVHSFSKLAGVPPLPLFRWLMISRGWSSLTATPHGTLSF